MDETTKSSVSECEIDLDIIRTDGGTQMRLEIRTDKIEEYAEKLKEGDIFPRIDVFYDGYYYWLADGFHRVQAMMLCKITKALARLHHGTLRDAILFAICANARHGIELTSGDKKKKIITLLQDKEWSRLSSKELSEKASVSHSYFNKVKAEIFADGLLSGKPILAGQKAPASTIKEIRKQVAKETRQLNNTDLADMAAFKPPLKDAFGVDLPDKALEAFEDLRYFLELRALLKQAITKARHLAARKGGKLLEHEAMCLYLNRAIEKLYESEPYAACSVCKDANPLCGRCHGSGWVNRLSCK